MRRRKNKGKIYLKTNRTMREEGKKKETATPKQIKLNSTCNI